jgi:hypothetical protein
VSGTSYPGNTVNYDVVSPSTTLSGTLIFSDLLLTDLRTGDYITMVH